MKNLKKSIALLSALALAGTLLAGCDPEETTPDDTAETTAPVAADAVDENVTAELEVEESDMVADGGGTNLRIYGWNDDFYRDLSFVFGNGGSGYNVGDTFDERVTEIDGIPVEYVVTPSADGAYRQKLDTDLPANTGSNPIDIFMIEANDVRTYVNSDFSLNVAKIGITADDTAQMYSYPLAVATSSGGELKGVAFQACPAGLIYRRSIAVDMWGTDDPATIQEKVKDWDTLEATAAELKDKGYTLVASNQDTFFTVDSKKTTPWVDSNDNILIDQTILDWVDRMKTWGDNGWTNGAYNMWGGGQWDVDSSGGKVFSYFGPSWFFSFSMGTESAGDWAVTEGPALFNWGGSYIMAANGTDNADLVAKVMKTMTSDEWTLKLAVQNNDFPNNKNAVSQFGSQEGIGSFVGGQNYVEVFANAIEGMSAQAVSGYDALNEVFREAMIDYFNGNISKEEAIDNFYTRSLDRFPYLKDGR